MMIPPVGSMPKVMGRRTAIPVGAPIPGIAPMKVPKVQPIAPKRRFMGVRAMANPRMSMSKVSISS
jgi:hypothetical protein